MAPLDDWRPDVPGHLRAAYVVRNRDGTYTSTVAHDLGVPTRTARRWLKRAAALGLIDEYNGIPPAETFWDREGANDGPPLDFMAGEDGYARHMAWEAGNRA